MRCASFTWESTSGLASEGASSRLIIPTILIRDDSTSGGGKLKKLPVTAGPVTEPVVAPELAFGSRTEGVLRVLGRRGARLFKGMSCVRSTRGRVRFQTGDALASASRTRVSRGQCPDDRMQRFAFRTDSGLIPDSSPGSGPLPTYGNRCFPCNSFECTNNS